MNFTLRFASAARAGTIADLMIAAAFCVVASAFVCGAADAADLQTPANSRDFGQLSIHLSTSRPEVTVGSGFGVAADVENVSNTPVFLNCSYFVMIPPLEIDPDGPDTWWAVIQGNQGTKNFYTEALTLQPGDRTAAFWSGNQRRQNENARGFSKVRYALRDFVHILNFTPGEYTIKVIALYWPDEASARNHAANYRSQTAEIKVSVAAPQWVIILGAATGGIIAYLLFPAIRLKANRIEPFGLLTAALLSVIATILLSRISDTQFFVKITVKDFWGAIAVGFISVASGSSLLEKYVSSWGTPPAAGGGTAKSGDSVKAATEKDQKVA